MAFVNRVGERLNRPATIRISTSATTGCGLGLVTHDAGGLTAKDFELAAAADRLV